ncbi:hypothetical protein ACFYRI_36590 [Streptomyces microflavus]|uniref:hypothetical protein n=1 Tax=Streptomyces microflavus TaxID=1919 RepID=UPI0036D1923E
MIVKGNRPKAIAGIAAAAIAFGALSAAPAQADTSCNSTRLCWYQPNGNITNVDSAIVAWCSGTTYPGAIGNNKVRNRTTDSISVNYDYNGNGSIEWVDEQVVRLMPGDSATLNPSSRYFYCKGSHP